MKERKKVFSGCKCMNRESEVYFRREWVNEEDVREEKREGEVMGVKKRERCKEGEMV